MHQTLDFNYIDHTTIMDKNYEARSNATPQPLPLFIFQCWNDWKYIQLWSEEGEGIQCVIELPYRTCFNNFCPYNILTCKVSSSCNLFFFCFYYFFKNPVTVFDWRMGFSIFESEDETTCLYTPSWNRGFLYFMEFLSRI